MLDVTILGLRDKSSIEPSLNLLSPQEGGLHGIIITLVYKTLVQCGLSCAQQFHWMNAPSGFVSRAGAARAASRPILWVWRSQCAALHHMQREVGRVLCCNPPILLRQMLASTWMCAFNQFLCCWELWAFFLLLSLKTTRLPDVTPSFENPSNSDYIGCTTGAGDAASGSGGT